MADGRKVKCVMCQRSEETSVTGPLSTKDGVTAHQNCLLYASGLYCKITPEFDDLFGFSVEDVRDEVNRGNKLTCSKCKKKGAAAGCEVKRCKKSYHYPCAIEDKAKITEDPKRGTYGLFCPKHCQQPQGGAKNDGSENGMDSDSAVAGTSNNVNGAGSSKVYCLACEKTEGNISLESLSNSIIMLYCDKHVPSSHKRNSSVAGESVCSSDSSSSSSVTHRSPKKRLRVDDRLKIPLKRILSDSPSCSEDQPNTDMNIFAPIESDFDESAHSVPEQQFSKNDDKSLTVSAAGNPQESGDETILSSDAESQSLLLQEVESCTTRFAPGPALPQQSVQAEGSSSKQRPNPHIAGPSPARSEQRSVAGSLPCTSVAISSAPPEAVRASFSSSSLSPTAPPCDPRPRVSIDSSSFWKSCNAAGCTQAIFTDFIKMLNDISNRIQADQAGQGDYNLALSVMEASGKLTEFVDKQQKELKRKQTELMKAVAAMEDVVTAVRR
uniref:uncharacterized protein phf11 isoform X2 n=1 Tax=Solea senegalensis TaxID=28829 RepID=UPI001CD8A805|nr:uncharacterized protein phf11 isoform X2 [Solea senegalensis]